MIPVRAEGLPPLTLRTFAGPGDALQGSICPACDEEFMTGPVTLIHIGPGSDPEDQEKARAGRWHTGAAVAVHSACAGLTDEQAQEASA